MHRQFLYVLVFLLSAMGFNVHAFEEREFKSTEDAELFTSLVKELRCLVCQNQNIADSNAELAVDLRREIFAMINEGKGRKDIVDFMVQRYGEFVLYKPPLSATTFVLWFGPLILLLLGLFIIMRSGRGAATTSDRAPDRESMARARQLLDEDEY